MGDTDYQALEFEYRPQPSDAAGHHPIVVVGAGPVGLSLALDLAQRGSKVVVLDDDYRLSTGSRAICFAKRTLDVWDRLGVGQKMVDKGVSWNVGKVFFKGEEVWRFDLLPEPGHRRPAFINLQQYYCEGFLCEQAAAHPGIELRWKHKAVGVENRADGVLLTVETPDGPYTLTADWLVACDGSRSPLRKMLGQEAHGRIFRDRFLIADVRMQAEFPTERWFWFDPPFHPNQSVLLHRQPDNIWRIDFQLGWNADPVEEVKPENVLPRIRALLGKDTAFELEWVSIYTFACERMDHFRHGRVLFAGDSAHRVSPFGARGANSGVQDADNLAWKLHLVTRGLAPEALIDSYAAERELAADENIRHSTHSTDFITPKSEISLLFRNTVLKLAKHYEFARALVNSGRLSTATAYTDTPLNTPDTERFTHLLPLGVVAPDAPVQVEGRDAWWLSCLDGRYTVVIFCRSGLPPQATLQQLDELRRDPLGIQVILVAAPACAGQAARSGLHTVVDAQGVLARRYDAREHTTYLIRPDQHIAARWRACHEPAIRAALRRASGHLEDTPA
ncbi:FAD-dependent oxidoreductase [Candidimonas nitroreducens]|uniref:FAD-dependent oxidoreductase n=1 Tax=Candidimonas nitroreducens TaxID=683354 RepID=A0A225MAQ3_9BURK|nr:FAD-dependent oxidoreductase [Candidimonas nitroreducens]OWT58367.1 FAD-dependent oxidoreductase [Candidimonas nitroreducens]